MHSLCPNLAQLTYSQVHTRLCKFKVKLNNISCCNGGSKMPVISNHAHCAVKCYVKVENHNILTSHGFSKLDAVASPLDL